MYAKKDGLASTLGIAASVLSISKVLVYAKGKHKWKRGRTSRLGKCRPHPTVSPVPKGWLKMVWEIPTLRRMESEGREAVEGIG